MKQRREISFGALRLTVPNWRPSLRDFAGWPQRVLLTGLGGLVLAVTAYAAWRFYPTFSVWEPNTADTARSEVFRNYGLVLAGCIGIAIAIWRGYQTDKQIKQVQEQLDRDTQRSEHERFLAAVEDASSETESRRAIGLASIISYTSPLIETPFKDRARNFVKAEFHRQTFVNGMMYSDQVLWGSGLLDTSIANIVSDVHFKNAPIVLGSAGITGSTPAFESCRFEGVRIMATDPEAALDVYDTYVDDLSLVRFKSILFKGCVLFVDRISSMGFASNIRFEGCFLLDHNMVDNPNYLYMDCTWMDDLDRITLINRTERDLPVRKNPLRAKDIHLIGGVDDPIKLRRIEYKRPDMMNNTTDGRD